MKEIRFAPDELARFKRLSPRHPEARVFIETVLRSLFQLKRLQAYDVLKRGKAVVIEDDAWFDTLAPYFTVRELENG